MVASNPAKSNRTSVFELRRLIITKQVSASEIVECLLKHVQRTDPNLNAFISVLRDSAFEKADEVDKRISRGEAVGLLAGIPIAIKDNICTKSIPTTAASKILYNYVPPYDATVVSKLKQADAVIVGKTNLDEFAMGASTETSYFGPTRNPWDLERVPGGTSGGSAVAVATGMCLAALGSDTGGSIRQPASLCGVVGLKPTYGRVSRYGLIAHASSLDQIGPIATDVADAAILLGAISGHDPLDSTSADLPVPDYLNLLQGEIKGIKVGIPKEYFLEGIDSEVEKCVLRAVRVLGELGAICEDITLPHTPFAIPAYYLIAPSEASANLARYDGVRYGYRTPNSEDLRQMYRRTRDEGFGAEVKRRIMLGTYALSAGYYDEYYLKAKRVQTLIKQDFEKAFEHHDVLVTPTSPYPAFKLGQKIEDPLEMYLADVYTVSINLAGVPAISIPCGFSKNALPIGLQIIGRHFDEPTVLRVAHAYQESTDFHKEKPPIIN